MSQRGWLDQIGAHARESYPEECCGAILESPQGRLRAYPLRNIQNRLHAEDPRRHPRDARSAYFIAPEDLLDLEHEAHGGAMVAIYHSHSDAEATFSETDQRQAAPLGEPLLAGVRYLVVSVVKGEVRDVALYAWRSMAGRYTPVPLESLGGGTGHGRG